MNGTVQVGKGASPDGPSRGTLPVARREVISSATAETLDEAETEILVGSDLDQHLIGSDDHLSEPDASDVMATAKRTASGTIFSQPTAPKMVSPLESTSTLTSASDEDDTRSIDLAETVALRPSGELVELDGLETTVDARSSTHRLARAPARGRTRSARSFRRRLVVIGLIATFAVTGVLVGFWISDPGEDPALSTGVPDLTSFVSQSPAEAAVEQDRFDAFSSTATLVINSKPEGAAIRINSTPISEVTPLEHTLAPGTHKVEASFIGFESQVQQVTVELGQSIKLNFVLRPEAQPPPKKIAVVQIRKNRRRVGKPIRRKKRRPKRKHTKPKPKPKHRPSPPVVASKVPPRPEALSYGFLTVNTVPWSRVFLNGKLIGTTPLANVRVVAGTHNLRFFNPSGPVARRTVVVRTGMVTKLRFNLPQ